MSSRRAILGISLFSPALLAAECSGAGIPVAPDADGTPRVYFDGELHRVDVLGELLTAGDGFAIVAVSGCGSVGADCGDTVVFEESNGQRQRRRVVSSERVEKPNPDDRAPDLGGEQPAFVESAGLGQATERATYRVLSESVSWGDGRDFFSQKYDYSMDAHEPSFGDVDSDLGGVFSPSRRLFLRNSTHTRRETLDSRDEYYSGSSTSHLTVNSCTWLGRGESAADISGSLVEATEQERDMVCASASTHDLPVSGCVGSDPMYKLASTRNGENGEQYAVETYIYRWSADPVQASNPAEPTKACMSYDALEYASYFIPPPATVSAQVQVAANGTCGASDAVEFASAANNLTAVCLVGTADVSDPSIVDLFAAPVVGPAGFAAGSATILKELFNSPDPGADVASFVNDAIHVAVECGGVAAEAAELAGPFAVEAGGIAGATCLYVNEIHASWREGFGKAIEHTCRSLGNDLAGAIIGCVTSAAACESNSYGQTTVRNTDSGACFNASLGACAADASGSCMCDMSFDDSEPVPCSDQETGDGQGPADDESADGGDDSRDAE